MLCLTLVHTKHQMSSFGVLVSRLCRIHVNVDDLWFFIIKSELFLNLSVTKEKVFANFRCKINVGLCD